MNLRAIADAIAGRFSGVTANGEPIQVGPTASLPNAITQGPALLVYPPTGTLLIVSSATNLDQYDFPVMLLRDPLDVPTRTDALYYWADAMRGRIELDSDLGLPTYVGSAEASAIRVELDGETYAGTLFDVVELTVHVLIHEPGYPVG